MSEKPKKDKTGSVFEWPLIRRIISYTRPYKGWFILAFVMTISSALLNPIRPLLVQQALDGPLIEGDNEGLFHFVMALLVLLLVQGLVFFLSSYLTAWIGQSVIRDIRNQVYNHITSLRLKFFDKTPIGTLQTRTISDVETLNEVFSQGIVGILGELLQLIFIFGLMAWTSWKLTLIVLITLPLLLTATYIFKNKIKVAFQKVRKYVSLMNAFLQEHITGMMITQIFNRESVESGKFKELNKGHQDANIDSVLYYSIFFPVVEIIGSLGVALIIWYGAGAVLNQGLTFGILVAFIMYLNMFFRPIRMLADRFNTLQMGMVSGERIFKILDTQDKIENLGKDPFPGVKGQKGLSISFDRVNFAYNEPEWILKDVSFDVKPGEKVAIVGSTGSGKTTLINLLTRFYELNRGTIRINDVNIESLDLQTLRSKIGLVLQDVFLFSGSIRSNISLDNPGITDEQVEKATKMVGADKFIQQLPGQYEFNVQERGSSLSTGQRQLITFARVLAYDPGILILDEATSSVDTESEQLIQEALEKVMKGRTSIIIAHRLSTIQKADKILVMSKGRIVESGSHQELLKEGGMYHRLYQLQYASV